ncbi:MAG TPA: hypothetical protein VLE99_04825 [Candidatus Saccharimonadales bacterium]|nr:hypothetical protein [Candidatus Saccharimonadales bacterium]
MQPNQPAKPSGPGPQPPYRPQEYAIDPNAVHSAHPAKHSLRAQDSAPQQGANGQYEVLPAPTAAPNNGHTGHNPYEFIVNPATPPKRPFSFSLGGGSLVKRLAVIVGGVALLVIVGSIVLSTVLPKGNAAGLIAIAQRQQEIVRIAADATGQAGQQDTLNFVTNTQVSITSSQQQMLSYLTTHGVKISSQLLAADQDSQTDAQLDNAASANNYDAAVAQNLTAQLQAYEILLQNTYKSSSNKQTKDLLQTCYDSAAKLVEQAKGLSVAAASN